MKKTIFESVVCITLFITVLLCNQPSFAQVKIGGTPVAPVPSAVLELDGGSSRGLLLPRMRKIDIDAIVNPAEGLTIYATDEQATYLRRSLNWVKLNGDADAFSLPNKLFFNHDDYVFYIQNTGSGACIGGNNVGTGPGVRGFSFKSIGVNGVAQEEVLGIGGYFVNNGGGRSLISMNFTGIGTYLPDALLHIDGATTAGATMIIDDDADPLVDVRKAGIQKGFIQLSANDMKIGTVATNDAGRFIVRTNGLDRVWVDSVGYVTIGGKTGPTINGLYKLAVKGKIAATEFNVVAPASWPDYVFGANYNLRSLAETETYINANKHLPNMPAAAVVEKEGYGLGDMQRRLLEKIEELTLHLIAADKEIQLLKKQMAERK